MPFGHGLALRLAAERHREERERAEGRGDGKEDAVRRGKRQRP